MSSFLLTLVFVRLKKRRAQLNLNKEEQFFARGHNGHGGDDDEEKRLATDSNAKANMSTVLDLIQKNQLILSKELGRGAFGTVYEGYYAPGGRYSYERIKVAIKVLNVINDKKARELNNEFLNVTNI